MRTLSVRLPEHLGERLDHEARDEGKSRSELARDAIAAYVERRERERFLAALAAEARALRATGDGERVAEEFVVAENEALDTALERRTALAESEADEDRWWD